MSLSTTAAPVESDNISSVTPYQVITLLLDGALERIDQAIISVSDGDMDEAAILVQKIMGIVNALRESLDMNKGGDIADNLDALYEYILARLQLIDTETPMTTLNEVKKLLQEVHTGWQGIGDTVE